MFCRSPNNGTPSLMFLLQVTLLIGFPLTVVAFSSSGCLDFCYHTRQNIKYAKSQPHRHYRTLTKILHPPRSVSPKNPFASTSSSSSTSLFAVSIDDRQAEQKSDMTATPTKIDNRPHEQRAKGPRLARRMNHGFKYLYRYNATNDLQDMTAFEYLSKYYTEDVIVEMNQTFPPLLNLSVSRHLHPKMRFLQETLGLAIDKVSMIPPQYFGARLERIIAPRHAFLKFMNLPYGRELIDDPQKWKDFLLSCRTTKRFCALCNQWRREIDNGVNTAQIISKQIEAFDTIFGRGALAASRNELCQHNNTWPLQQINITSGQLLELLIEHGANPFERDNRGVSLLHWACGTGNLDACTVLLKYFTNFEELQTERDGATPLHWAVAGANSREFGTGGHIDICRYLLNVSNDPKNFVNKLTHDGNSPLMWASWSGTLDTTKLMIRNRADPTVANRNGCKLDIP